MKFLQDAQKKVAKAVLRAKLQKQGAPVPSEEELDRRSEELVGEANRVLKQEGRRVWGELKDSYREITKKKGQP
jgi:hypothetical protein